MHDDKDLKSALDDIFGSDFIEIDVDKSSIDEKQEPIDIENQHNKAIFKDSEASFEIKSPVSVSNDDNEIEDKKQKSLSNANEPYIVPDSSKENNDLLNETILPLNETKEEKQDEILYINSKNEENNLKNDNFNKKIIIYVIIGFAIGFLLIYLLINYVFGTTKVVNCSTSAKDEGYKYTDEYKITYKKDKISYVEGIYTYTALNDEYKTQIEVIKEEKSHVLMNSNGMPGFTYTYETSDNFFKVNSYLDFALFDYDNISKIDQNLTPISYFKIDKKMTFKSLKKDLEKEGYVCVLSK